MTKADTNFPKVKGMLFHVSLMFFWCFWPGSTLIHGHIVLKSEMRMRALHFSQTRTHSPTSGMPNWCTFLWGYLCMVIGTFHWDFILWFLVLDACLTLCRVEEFGEGFGCVVFALSLISWRKLQLSLEHCPLAFHCQQSLFTLFFPWFLTTAFLS